MSLRDSLRVVALVKCVLLSALFIMGNGCAKKRFECTTELHVGSEPYSGSFSHPVERSARRGSIRSACENQCNREMTWDCAKFVAACESEVTSGQRRSSTTCSK